MSTSMAVEDPMDNAPAWARALNEKVDRALAASSVGAKSHAAPDNISDLVAFEIESWNDMLSFRLSPEAQAAVVMKKTKLEMVASHLELGESLKEAWKQDRPVSERTRETAQLAQALAAAIGGKKRVASREVSRKANEEQVRRCSRCGRLGHKMEIVLRLVMLAEETCRIPIPKRRMTRRRKRRERLRRNDGGAVRWRIKESPFMSQ